MAGRDYGEIARAVAARLDPAADAETRMQVVVDELWSALSRQGVSWCGFYLPDESGEQLLLGPRRDKPACSPIGLHGVCGRAFRERRPVVVRDVAELGPDYIACDPRDRSELVVPLQAEKGSCRAVLDLDSHQVGSFAESDVTGLEAVLSAAGLWS